MTGLIWVILAAVLWLVFAAACARILENPRGDVFTGLAYHAMRFYAFWFHRLKVEGIENIPPGHESGPLIVVANHTAGVDPVLVQSGCLFEIRWMMATTMRVAAFEWFWNWAGIISISPTGRDLGGTREAIRHVQSGGALGVFPEGGIERPPRALRPFHPGVGLIIARTGAPVLPVIIEGTPYARAAWGSLWRRGRVRLRFGEHLRFEGKGQRPDQITADLMAWFQKRTGWPINDKPMVTAHGRVTSPALPSSSS